MNKKKLFHTRLIALFISYFMVKIVTLIYLILQDTIVEPDESTFSEVVCLFDETSLIPQQISYYLRWGPVFLLSGEFFRFIGFTCLNALRFSSFVFSCLSAGIIFYLYLKISAGIELSKKQQLYTLISIAFFLFYPSRFLWTSLGLRESIIEFNVLLILLIVFKLMHHHNKITYVFILLGSLIALNLTRQFLYFALIMAIVCSIMFFPKNRALIGGTILFIVPINFVMPSIIMTTYTSYYLAQKNDEIESIRNQIIQLDKLSGNIPSKKQQLEKKLNSVKLLRDKAVLSHSDSKSIYRDIPEPEIVRYQRSVDARSRIPTKNCLQRSEGVLQWFWCNLKYAPIGLYSVILRPNPLHDWYSITTQIASLENIVFLLSFIFILVITVKSMRNGRFQWFTTTLLFFIYVCISGMAMYEGNVGTSMRHRLILISSFSLVFLSYIFSSKFRMRSLK